MASPRDFLTSLSQASAKDLNQLPDDDEIYQTQAAAREATVHNVHHTLFLLRQVLNADTARMVAQELDLYEIYRQKRKIDCMQCDESTCPVPCFIGDAIKARVRSQRPVRRVIFRFESHDQGWASNREGGSWTWFTAGVIPSTALVSHEDITSTTAEILNFTAPDFRRFRPPRNPGRPYFRGGQMHPVFPRPQPEPAPDVPMQEYSRNHPINNVIIREREVYRNRILCKDWETNTIVWDHNDANPEIAEWVQSLSIGDHIIVRAWARFAGWHNFVRAVSVAVCNTVII